MTLEASGPAWQRQVLALEAEGVVSRTFRRLDPPRQLAGVEALLVEAAAGGPGEVSVKRVAARAGVAVGSLYQYFPHREGMLDFAARAAAALLVESLEGYGEALAAIPLPDALAAYLAGGLDWSRQNVTLLGFFVRAAYNGAPGFGPTLVRPVALATQGLVRAIVSAAHERGELRPGVDVETATRLVHALCIAVCDPVLVPGLNDYFLLFDDDVRVGDIHAAAVDLVLNGLLATGRQS